MSPETARPSRGFKMTGSQQSRLAATVATGGGIAVHSIMLVVTWLLAVCVCVCTSHSCATMYRAPTHATLRQGPCSHARRAMHTLAVAPFHCQLQGRHATPDTQKQIHLHMYTHTHLTAPQLTRLGPSRWQRLPSPTARWGSWS